MIEFVKKKGFILDLNKYTVVIKNENPYNKVHDFITNNYYSFIHSTINNHIFISVSFVAKPQNIFLLNYSCLLRDYYWSF